MQTKTFKIIKKNRKYFSVETGGYAAKIEIDENSKSLEIGATVTLLVEDISVRSKYGTDLKFRLAASAEEQKTSGICSIKADYNVNLVERCRELGGQFDRDEMAWIFSEMVADQVEQLEEVYNSETITVEVSFPEGTHKTRGPVTYCGVPLAIAYGRDSGAKLGDKAAIIQGRIKSSGSMKNWCSEICEGTVMRVQMPRKVYEEYHAAADHYHDASSHIIGEENQTQLQVVAS